MRALRPCSSKENGWLVPGLKEQGWAEGSAHTEAKGRNREYCDVGGGRWEVGRAEGTAGSLTDGPTDGIHSPAAGQGPVLTFQLSRLELQPSSNSALCFFSL